MQFKIQIVICKLQLNKQIVYVWQLKGSQAIDNQNNYSIFNYENVVNDA